MPVNKCCYILRPNTRTQRAEYCGRKTKWKMVRDDDYNLVRKYNAFCDEHQRVVDEKKKNNTDEDGEWE
jgi:hypothetical protein